MFIIDTLFMINYTVLLQQYCCNSTVATVLLQQSCYNKPYQRLAKAYQRLGKAVQRLAKACRSAKACKGLPTGENDS